MRTKNTGKSFILCKDGKLGHTPALRLKDPNNGVAKILVSNPTEIWIGLNLTCKICGKTLDNHLRRILLPKLWEVNTEATDEI